MTSDSPNDLTDAGCLTLLLLAAYLDDQWNRAR